jgi:hypothetical protein
MLLTGWGRSVLPVGPCRSAGWKIAALGVVRVQEFYNPEESACRPLTTMP